MRGVVLVFLAGVLLSIGNPGSGGAAPTTAARWHLIFTSDRDGDVEVYGASPDGRRIAQLTRNRVEDWDVLISPTGRWLAVTRFSAPSAGALISADGRRERRLRGEPFAFSRDGSSLLVQTEDASEVGRVGVVSLRNMKLRTLGRGYALHASADRRLVSFYDDRDGVGLITVATGRRRILLPSDDVPDDFDLLAVWSPHWTRVAYDERDYFDDDLDSLVVLDTTPGSRPRTLGRADYFADLFWLDDDHLGFKRERTLVVTPVHGGSEEVIATNVGTVAWSPRRDAVAYVRVRPGEFSFVFDGFVVRSLRSDQTRSIDVPRYPDRVTWSPSGRWIAIPLGREILVAQPFGSDPPIRIDLGAASTTLGEVYQPVWSPDERWLALRGTRGIAVVPLGSRRVHVAMRGGRNEIVGWMRGPLPASAPAARAPTLETSKGNELRARGAIHGLAADRRWAAALVGESAADCDHVVAWTPGRRVTRFSLPLRCDSTGGNYSFFDVAISGTRVTWRSFRCFLGCYIGEWSADARRPGQQGLSEEVSCDCGDLPPEPPRADQSRRGVTMSLREGTIVLRRASDGAVTRLHPPNGAVDAELETTGLFYAYNQRGKWRGRVVFLPFSRLFR